MSKPAHAIQGLLPEASGLRYRFLIYGTCRKTCRLIKRLSWDREDTAESRGRQLEAARKRLIDARLISVELTRAPLEFS